MQQANRQPKIQDRRTFSATRLVASTFGAITSIAGVMHGCFEILQGNTAPSGLVMNAIGPDQRIWEYAALHAFTVVPNTFVTGILAIVFGLLSTIWAVAFIDVKSGPRVMFLLSIVLFLVGGGFGPLFNGTFASLVATRINKPLTWWRVRLSAGVRDLLVRLHPGILIFYVFVFLIAVETTVFGRPLNMLIDADTTYLIVLRVGNFMLLFMLLSTLCAFAYDIHAAQSLNERGR